VKYRFQAEVRRAKFHRRHLDRPSALPLGALPTALRGHVTLSFHSHAR
jgi:hypothetical protein